MELNLAVGEIQLKKVIPSKFNTCIKNSRRLHLLAPYVFNLMITMLLYTLPVNDVYFINFHPSDYGIYYIFTHIL